MSDFVNDAKDVQFQEYIEEGQPGDGLIRIQWRNGDPKTNSAGYFFLAKANAPEGFEPGAAWEDHTEYFEGSRTREAGWKATALPVCIICTRAQPYVRGTDGRKEWRTKWATNEQGAAQHVDVLLIADGLQELGPVCWSTNSTKAAFAIIGRADAKRGYSGGILERIRNEVLIPAGRHAGDDKKFIKQPWVFWVTITSEHDAKGTPTYTETPGKLVTLPVVELPAKIDHEWLKEAYSGKEMMLYGEEMRAKYDAWKTTKYTNEAQPEPTQPAKNAPELIDPDMPF